MLTALATLRTAQFWIKAAPYLLIAAAVLGGWLYVRGLQQTVERQKNELTGISGQLETERLTRQRDIAALTSLSGGLAQAATDTKRDQAILTETVTDAKAPASPQLRALFDELRKADAGSKPANPAGRSGG